MNITITIKAPLWKQENFEAFKDWFQEEMFMNNMYTADEVEIVSIDINQKSDL